MPRFPRVRPHALLAATGCLGLLLAAPVRAAVPVRLDVTYTGCTVVEGPLSLGLSALPPTITARFVFLSPTYPPPSSGTIFEPPLLFAELRLGDLLTTLPDVEYFRIAFFPDPDGGLDVSQLTWLGHKGATDTACGIDTPNSFGISITGITRASPLEACPEASAASLGSTQTAGEFFHYRCNGSSETYAQVTPINTGLAAKKLVVATRPSAGTGKTVYVVAGDAAAGVAKGAGTNPDTIAAHFGVSYTGGGGATAGEHAVPQGERESGDRSGWLSNSADQAKYTSRDAPASPSGTRMTLIRPGKVLKLLARSAGDTPLDLLDAGAPTGSGVTTVYTLFNAGQMRRFCTRFPVASCTHTENADGTAAKLVCRDGNPIACP